MSKNARLIAMGLSIAMIGGVFTGCSSNEKKESNEKAAIEQKEGEESKAFEEVQYVYDNGKEKVDVKVEKAPQKAVTLSQFMTEMLLALDLGDRMVGTALLDNEILPEFKEAYDKIPVLEVGEGHSISKEAFVATGADFVSGWDSSISDETTGSAKELAERGVAPYLAKSYTGDSTIEDVYEDFLMLGKIFGVQEKAKKVVEAMKKDISDVQASIGDKKDEEKVKVMVYDSGEKDAMVVGGGLGNNLIELAGGKNIYGDMEKPYENVSFESIVKANPDVILITDFLAGQPAQEKIDFLKNHPALKEVNAVKNNNFHIIGLADLSPGVRNTKLIKKMNEIFYK